MGFMIIGDAVMSLKVIGTGFGRTGTDSMRMALNILGFGPTHHMLELSDKPVLYERWIDLAHGFNLNGIACLKVIFRVLIGHQHIIGEN